VGGIASRLLWYPSPFGFNDQEQNRFADIIQGHCHRPSVLPGDRMGQPLERRISSAEVSTWPLGVAFGIMEPLNTKRDDWQMRYAAVC
jgi:hypothetical protein